jgi:hypothetical protein
MQPAHPRQQSEPETGGREGKLWHQCAKLRGPVGYVTELTDVNNGGGQCFCIRTPDSFSYSCSSSLKKKIDVSPKPIRSRLNFDSYF